MKVRFIQLLVFIFFFILSVAGCGGGGGDGNNNGDDSTDFDVSAVPDISGEWELSYTTCVNINVNNTLTIEQDGIELTFSGIGGTVMSGGFTSLQGFRMQPPDTSSYAGLSITGKLEADGDMRIYFVANGECSAAYRRPEDESVGGTDGGSNDNDNGNEEDVCSSFVVTPSDIIVGFGDQVSFSGENGTPPYTWSVDSEIGSTIDENGLYTAGSEMSLDIVTVTDSNNCEAGAYVEVSEE